MMRWVAASLLTLLTLPAQDILDLQWRTGESGALEVLMGEAPTGAQMPATPRWAPMFPGLEVHGADAGRALLVEVGSCGVIGVLPLLLHGDGGAADLADGARRRQKLGTRNAAMPAISASISADPLLDLLRVQALAALDVNAAHQALVHFAQEERRSPFVRAAAVAALVDAGHGAELPPELLAQRPGRAAQPALRTAVERLPDDADLVIGMNTARLGACGPVLAASRRYAAALASFMINSGSTGLDLQQVSQMQVAMDLPGQLPYELAAHFGNWRVDAAVFALRCGPMDAWWFQLGGAFAPETWAQGLRAAGLANVEVRGAATLADVLDWHLRITATTFEAWQGDLDATARGALLGSMADHLGGGAAPAWFVVPETSRFAARIGANGARIDLNFNPATMLAVVKAGCTDAAAADDLLARFTAWQRLWPTTGDVWPPGRALPPGTERVTWEQVAEAPPGTSRELGKGYLLVRRVIQAMTAKCDGTEVHFRCDLSPFPLVELARLLRGWPSRFWLRPG